MRRYHLVDWLTQGYLALVGLIILLFHGDLPFWPVYVLGHAGGLVAVHVLIRLGERSERPLVRFLRAFYPMILYTVLYTETHALDGLFVPGRLDGTFIDLDQRLFGRQLCRTIMQAHPQRWVAELFYASYFSYYVMVFGVGMGMYLCRRGRFLRYLAVVSLVFYACYLTYIFLPVMGPYGTQPGVTFQGALASVGPRAVPASVESAFFYKVMGLVYEAVEPEGGAAFPSSHVAVALVTLWFSWTYLRRVRYVHLAAAIMLCLSTVYCGYHYVVDVLAGIATAAVLAPLGLWLTRRWEARTGGDKSAGAPRSTE